MRATGFAARYEDPAKLHATLAFLGNVDGRRAGEVVAALDAAAGRCASFALALDKLAAFPHERTPRVVYIGARAQGAGFRAAATAVRDAYRELGFRFEQDAVAHVTIARVKAPQRALPSIDVGAIAVRASAIALFESLPDKANNTSRYEVLHRASLRAP